MFLILFESIGSITYDNGIFQKHYNEGDIIVTASGSSKQQINDTDQLTKPEYAIYPWEKKYDWCSQISHSYEDHPYIVFAMKSKKFKFNGYFVRCGCCYDGCCCDDDYYHYCLDCCLYSWSLQISDDNKTWKTIHQVEKDDSMRICSEKEYHLDKEYISRYVRLIQDKPVQDILHALQSTNSICTAIPLVMIHHEMTNLFHTTTMMTMSASLATFLRMEDYKFHIYIEFNSFHFS